jgi:hypothetical protein
MSCFGLLGAAATCGQLVGSMLIASTSYCHFPARILLLIAVVCMEICAQLLTKMGECMSRASVASSSSPGGSCPPGAPPYGSPCSKSKLLPAATAPLLVSPPPLRLSPPPPLPSALQPPKPPPKGDMITTISIILRSNYLLPMLGYSLCYSSLR